MKATYYNRNSIGPLFEMDDSVFFTIILEGIDGPLGIALDPFSMGQLRDQIDIKIQSILDKHKIKITEKFNPPHESLPLSLHARRKF